MFLFRKRKLKQHHDRFEAACEQIRQLRKEQDRPDAADKACGPTAAADKDGEAGSDGQPKLHKCRVCPWTQEHPCTYALSKRERKRCMYQFVDEDGEPEPGPILVCGLCGILYSQDSKCLLCQHHIGRTDVHVRGRKGFCKACAHHYDQQLSAQE
jgi:hypothetical protein